MCGSRTVTTALQGGRESLSERKGRGLAMLVGDESGGEKNRKVRACYGRLWTEGTIFGAAIVLESLSQKHVWIISYLMFCQEEKMWKYKSQMDEMAHTNITAKQHRTNKSSCCITRTKCVPPSPAEFSASQLHITLPALHSAFVLTFQCFSAPKCSLSALKRSLQIFQHHIWHKQRSDALLPKERQEKI